MSDKVEYTPAQPSVLVATITADRRLDEHSGAIPHKLNYPNMLYYLNVETNKDTSFPPLFRIYDKAHKHYGYRLKYDLWHVSSLWRPQPQYDQDQARLWKICLAREMCRQAAIMLNVEWLLFLDSDVVPPEDAIQRLLKVAVFHDAVRHHVVGGIVPGRGAHSTARYITFPTGTKVEMIESSEPGRVELSQVVPVQHATMGFVMIHRNVFNWVGFTFVRANHWYVDPNGVKPEDLSEDPAFGIWLRYVLKQHPNFGPAYEWVVTDVEAQHVGDLKAEETAHY